MARSRIPDAIQRRVLIEQELEPSRAKKLADAYLEAGRSFEALAFLAKAGDREGLAALRDAAIAAGDVFLLRESALLLGEEPDAEAWRALAAAAAAEGKRSYAIEAERRLTAREGSG